MSHRLSSVTDQIVQADDLLNTHNKNRLFIDARLGEPADELKSFRDAHIHGAVHAQIRDVFAAPRTAQSGNLPLPDISKLAHVLDEWGVDAETELIVYGPSLALAARAWWVLRWAGGRTVKVLDGGLKAWTTQGGPLAQGDAAPRQRPSGECLSLSAGNMPSIVVSEVEKLEGDVFLVDARDEASFLAGSIPGAVNLPSSEQWTPGSTFRTVEELRAIYEGAGALDATEAVAYCGGGVLSALTVLNLSTFGVTPRLYVGSWSEWSKSPERMARSANERVTT